MKHAVLLGSILAAAVISPGAADSYTDADFEVSDPFASEQARTNFGKCYKDTAPSDLENFRTIRYWGYRFSEHVGCPPTNPACEPTTKFFRLRRTLQTDASQGNPSKVFASIQAQENHSCTSPIEFSSYSANVTNKNVEYRFHARGRKRVCPFWGGSWTMAEGNVDVISGAALQPDFSIATYSRKENESGKLLGFISGGFAEAIVLGVLNPLGFALPALAKFLVVDPLMADLNGRDFLGAGINLSKGLEDTPLGQVGDAGAYKISFVTQAAESGFRLSGDQLNVEILQDGYSPVYLQDNFRKIRKLEIDFLKSLSEVGPEAYVVQRGDNFWKLADKKFGDGRLFLYLAAYNGKDPTKLWNLRLRVGEVLQVPRWHELCDKLKPNQLFVRDDETLWMKATAGQIPFDFNRIKHRTTDANLIYPYEELTVLSPAPPKRSYRHRHGRLR